MKKRTRTRRLILALCVIAGLVVLGTGMLVVDGLRDEPGRADAALVPGSKVERDGMLSPRLRARLDKTLELYMAGYFPKIITSGAVGEEGWDEAVVMRDYLVANGVPADAVIVDSGGTNTFASAKNTLRIARQQNFHSIFVVSQYFHISRTRMALHRFGIPEVYSAHAQIWEWRDIYSSFREFFGCLSYLLKSYDSAAAG